MLCNVMQRDASKAHHVPDHVLGCDACQMRPSHLEA